MTGSNRGRRLLALFPRTWQDRYGDEFLALLAQRPLSARDLLDIVASAADARIHPKAWQPEGQFLFEAAGPPTSGPPAAPPPPQLPESPAMRRFTRRTFLRNTVLGGAAIATAGMAGGAIIYAWPETTSLFGTEIIVPADQVPAPGDAPRKFNSGKFYLAADQDGVLALYWKCPHLGCTVPWNDGEDQFHCPCHQSIYDRHGVLKSGPAPRPMDLMALRFDEAGNAIVHTGEITKREGYSPEQAVRPPG